MWTEPLGQCVVLGGKLTAGQTSRESCCPPTLVTTTTGKEIAEPLRQNRTLFLVYPSRFLSLFFAATRTGISTSFSQHSGKCGQQERYLDFHLCGQQLRWVTRSTDYLSRRLCETIFHDCTSSLVLTKPQLHSCSMAVRIL